MNKEKIIYLDLANSVEDIRPAERKIFFDILPKKGYKITTLFCEKKNNKSSNNINIVFFNKKKSFFYYYNLYKALKKLIIKDKYDFIVIRNETWIGLVTLVLCKKYPIKKIFIRAFPSELLSINNAKKHFIIRRILSIIKNKLLLKISHFIISKYDIVFARSDFFAKQLSNSIKKKVYSLPMGFDTSWIVNEKVKNKYIEKYKSNSRKLAGYFGAIDEGRNIDFILEIFKKLFSFNKDINGIIVTNADKSDLLKIKKLSNKYKISKKLNIIGPFNYSEMPNILSILDLTISPIPPVDAYLVSSPTKTIESIGLGIPVIGNKEIEDQHKIITNSGCGFSINYNTDDFYEACIKIMNLSNTDDFKKKGINYIKNNRSYEILAKKFEDIIFR